jgi:hypothetical protein
LSKSSGLYTCQFLICPFVQEFVTKSMSRWRLCIGPVIHLAAYKRLQSLQCHSDFNTSSITLLTLSLSTKNESTPQKNPEKAQEHDEQIHHPKTLTEFSYHQTHQFSSNSSHNRIKNITQHRIPHLFHKKQTNSQGRGRSFQRF